jgi:SAM-dependent methyltransferase
MGITWKIYTQSYKGLKMACAPGTHETAMELLLKHVAPCGPVIDLGACTGAFLQRLRDAGFFDLSGVEYEDRIELADVQKLQFDLNSDFARHFSKKFRLVTSTEVIEHLDSPRHFLKQVYEILEDDGYLLLSLPNIGHWMGRVKFFLFGELWGFGARHYRDMRHISPVTDAQMVLMLNEIGYRVVGKTTGGDFSSPLRRLAYSPARFIFQVIGGSRTDGDSAIYLAQKTKPNIELRRERNRA